MKSLIFSSILDLGHVLFMMVSAPKILRNLWKKNSKLEWLFTYTKTIILLHRTSSQIVLEEGQHILLRLLVGHQQHIANGQPQPQGGGECDEEQSRWERTTRHAQ